MSQVQRWIENVENRWVPLVLLLLVAGTEYYIIYNPG